MRGSELEVKVEVEEEMKEVGEVVEMVGVELKVDGHLFQKASL